MSNEERIIGHVAGLWRYPVKSMRAEPLHSTRVWWHGFEGDRRYAFIRSSDYSHFPWLTGRQIPRMVQYQTHFKQPDDPVKSPILITTPAGQQYVLEDEHLRQELEKQAGEAVHLMQIGRGAYDSSAGISMISTNTLASFGQFLEDQPAVERFRCNILIETSGLESYPEDSWTGSTLQFGERADSVCARIIRPIVRCMMINLDPKTAKQNPDVLRTVVNQHDTLAGVYGVPERVGSIVVGDKIRLL